MPRETIDTRLLVKDRPFYYDYTHDFAKVAPFFPGNPKDLAAYKEVAHDPALLLSKRSAVHASLNEYNNALGASRRSIDNVDRLRYDGSYCVIAWSQPYLLGGPLQTYYKAISAIALAARLNEAKEDHFVPILWCETDYRGLRDLNKLTLIQDGRLVDERLEVLDTDRPADEVDVREALEALFQRLEKRLERAPAKGPVMELLRASAGATLGDTFNRLMLRLFAEEGLVVAKPELFRPLVPKILERELRDPTSLKRNLETAAERIAALGYRKEEVDADPLSLYYIDGRTYRRVLLTGDGHYEIEGGRRLSINEMLTELQRYPQRFSVGLFLSSCVQDFVLPTVGHVAGLYGVKHWALLKDVYNDLNLAMPVVFPKLAATLLDKDTAAGLKQAGLDVVSAFAQAAESGEARYDEAARALEKKRAALVADLEGYGRELATLDPRAAGRWSDVVTRVGADAREVNERAIEGMRERLEAGRQKVAAAVHAVAPRGRMQENALSGVHAMAQHGLDVFRRVAAEADPFEFDHQLIYL